MYKLREHVTEEMIAGLAAALKELPTKIEGLTEVRCGPDAGDRERVLPDFLTRHDFVVVLDFDDVSGYTRFQTHPAKLALQETHLHERCSTITGCDFTS